MDAGQRTWLINLDAEREVEAFASGRVQRFDPFGAFEARAEIRHALAPLFGDDVVLRRGDDRDLRATLGRAWCMTDGAREALSRAGARVLAGPSMATLQRCMSRGFAHEVGPGLRGWFIQSPHDPHVSGEGPWLLRSAYGFAGRGRCISDQWPPVEPAARSFIARAIGGVLVSPLVRPSADFAQHGYVLADRLVTGEPTTLEIGAGGVWRNSRRASPDDLDASERAALLERLVRAGRALSDAGYVGPFGIDAFRYADGFCAMCEINVRYTMGWAIGMGDRRPDLE